VALLHQLLRQVEGTAMALSAAALLP
jgi:hypothetical protein